MKRILFIGVVVLLVCSACKTYQGDLSIKTGSDLDEFAKKGYTRIAGRLVIENTSLSSLKGLETLVTVDYGVRIENNCNLTDLKGLDNLTSVGMTPEWVTTNGMIGSWMYSGIEINNNANLKSLSGLGSISKVGLNNFIISKNDSIVNLEGLGKLSSGIALMISDNDALENLEGLENATELVAISLWDNKSLSNLKGAEGIVSLRGGLDITRNNSLTTISDLKTLSVLGELWVEENNSLENLAGLEKIKYLNDLTIIGNPLLTGLGLDSLEAVKKYYITPFSMGSFEISGNASLCESVAEELLEQVNKGLVGVTGTVTVRDNKDC